MTTIVNNPASTESGGGIGLLIGGIILVGLVAVLLYFGIPALKRMGPVQGNAPAAQVVLPNKIEVDVTQPN